MCNEERNSSDFCLKAAKFSVFAPLATMFVNALAKNNRPLSIMIAAVWLVSFLLGLYALVVSLKNNIKGVKRYALVGVLLPGFLLLMAALAIPNLVKMKERFKPYELVELESMSQVNSGYKVVYNEENGFRYEVPNTFIEEKVAGKPNIQAYVAANRDGEVNVSLHVARMGGVIPKKAFSREQLSHMKKTLPPGGKLERTFVNWNSYKVDLLKSTILQNGQKIKVYSVQIPLIKEAVQVNLTTLEQSEDESLKLFNKILQGFKGKSNWPKI